MLRGHERWRFVAAILLGVVFWNRLRTVLGSYTLDFVNARHCVRWES